MGYEKEVEIVRLAHKMEMLTCPYVFEVDETGKITEAGADVIVAHMNTTVKGSIGISSDLALSLEDAGENVQEIHDAAKKFREDVIVLCHRGPIAEPVDAQYTFDNRSGIAGFFGASSIERLATEVAIEDQAHMFKEHEVNR